MNSESLGGIMVTPYSRNIKPIKTDFQDGSAVWGCFLAAGAFFLLFSSVGLAAPPVPLPPHPPGFFMGTPNMLWYKNWKAAAPTSRLGAHSRSRFFIKKTEA